MTSKTSPTSQNELNPRRQCNNDARMACNKPDLTMEETTLYSAAMTDSMAHTNIHDPSHVYSNRELPLTQRPVDNTIDTLHHGKW